MEYGKLQVKEVIPEGEEFKATEKVLFEIEDFDEFKEFQIDKFERVLFSNVFNKGKEFTFNNVITSTDDETLYKLAKFTKENIKIVEADLKIKSLTDYILVFISFADNFALYRESLKKNA